MSVKKRERISTFFGGGRKYFISGLELEKSERANSSSESRCFVGEKEKNKRRCPNGVSRRDSPIEIEQNSNKPVGM